MYSHQHSEGTPYAVTKSPRLYFALELFGATPFNRTRLISRRSDAAAFKPFWHYLQACFFGNWLLLALPQIQYSSSSHKKKELPVGTPSSWHSLKCGTLHLTCRSMNDDICWPGKPHRAVPAQQAFGTHRFSGFER